MEAVLVEEKKFKLFGKKDAPPKPIPKAEEPPKVIEEQTAQEAQINALFVHIQRIKESTALLEGELINLIKNS